MNSTKKYMDIGSLQRLILNKRQSIIELQNNYDESPEESNHNHELKDLYNQFLQLRSEIEILELTKPVVIPKCKPLLFAWAHHIMQEEVRNLEELYSFQESMKRLSLEKKLELRKLCEKEKIECCSDKETFSYQELLDSESLRSEILQCLHTKLIRRLRRICRNFYPSIIKNEQNVDVNNLSNKKEKLKSMFFILQKLLVDLKNNSIEPVEWEVASKVKIDESFPEEYITLLQKCEIVELTGEKSEMYMKLIAK